MPRQSSKTPQPKRRPLSREVVIRRAVELADAEGPDGLSMRKLAQNLGVEAMSLYNHVKNKDDLLNAMVETIYEKMHRPRQNTAWRDELLRRGRSMHEELLAHPWAAALMETRGTGPMQLAMSEATLGCLKSAGFSIKLAHRALLLMDSYLYGFAFQEVVWPYERQELPEVIDNLLPQMDPGLYPHVIEVMHWVSTSSAQIVDKRSRKKTTQKRPVQSAYNAEFEFGLALILDGLERSLDCTFPGPAASGKSESVAQKMRTQKEREPRK